MSTKTSIEWTEKESRRFWDYVKKTTNCWNWIGGTFGGRYGQFRVGIRKVKAHRFSWLLAGNSIPDGLILCHTCDNMRCVNPAHLFLGTHADNSHDRDQKGRASKKKPPSFPGESNPSAKLTAIEVFEIRSALSAGVARKHIATLYRISRSTINSIAQGKAWQV